MEWAYNAASALWELPEAERIEEAVKRRLLIRAAVESSVVNREKVLERSAADPVGWINDWIWTYDPRNIERGLPATIPLDLWPRQVEFVEWLEQLEHDGVVGVAEKCRDAGGTCVALAFMLHRWRFVEGYAGGVGSRKEELVDRRDDPDSLFEKFRFMLRWLPRFMLPRGFGLDLNCSHRRLINPENGATITGEGGPNIGRGGRKTFYLVDEAAHLQHARMVDAALSHNSRVQVWLSSPSEEGRASLFAQKRFSGEYPVFEFDWRDDPRKPDDYLQRQLAKFRYAPELVRREVLRSYETIGESHVCPSEWLDEVVGLELPERAGIATVGFDVADGGLALNVAIGRRGPVVVECESWLGDDHTSSVERVIDMAIRIGAEEIRYDELGVGAGPKTAFRAHKDRLEQCKIRVVGVNTGRGASDIKYDGKPAAALFRNLRTELWFAIRRRVSRTRDFVRATGRDKAEFDFADLFAIRSNVAYLSEIVAQLGLLVWKTIEGGRVRVESKDELRSRGFASPDFADAVVLAFADAATGAGGGWLKRMLRGE